MIQALHNYTLYTYVFVYKPMFDRCEILFVALVAPLVFVVPTAVFSFGAYINLDTCWIDYSQRNAVIQIVPNFVLVLLTVILGEATPMRKYNVHPAANHVLRVAARSNARAAILISFASFGAFSM